MQNHKMMTYDFIEGKDFEGLMPKIAEKVGVTGKSDVNIKMHGMEVNGMDSLEVIDIEAAYSKEEATEE